MVLPGLLVTTLALQVAPRHFVTPFGEFLGLAAPILLILGLVLALAGRSLVKILIFLAGGIVGASVGFAFTRALVGTGIWPYLGAALGFVAVGFIAYGLAFLAFGLIVGALAFSLVRLFIASNLLALLAAVIGFILGIVLFNYYLSIATALGGGAMSWYALHILGLPTVVAVLAGIGVALIGMYIQLSQLRSKRPGPPPAPPTAPPPS